MTAMQAVWMSMALVPFLQVGIIAGVMKDCVPLASSCGIALSLLLWLYFQTGVLTVAS